jgi:hypothetical protein
VTVSNEDRDLVNEIVHTLHHRGLRCCPSGTSRARRRARDQPARSRPSAAEVKAALIAHGWGPRAKLPSGKINDWLEVAVYAIDNADSEIRADLAAVGIEVTE